jgi:SOS response regulatory protein OraA/RecX
MKRICIILSVITVLMTGCGSSASEEPNTTEAPAPVTTDTNAVENTEPVQPTSNEPTLTMGQKNALQSAYDYLDYTAFSYKGLVAQLEYEGYSNADAVFAADRCGADWNEQAAKKAAEYLDYSSFSRQGLIDQLVYEGFSSEQATYGVTAVGY